MNLKNITNFIKHKDNIVTNNIINPKQIVRKIDKKHNVYVVDSYNNFTNTSQFDSDELTIGEATSLDVYRFRHKKLKKINFKSVLPIKDIHDTGKSYLNTLVNNGKLLKDNNIVKNVIFLGPTRGGFEGLSLGLIGTIETYALYELLRREVFDLDKQPDQKLSNTLFFANLHKANNYFQFKGKLIAFDVDFDHDLSYYPQRHRLSSKRKPKTEISSTYTMSFNFSLYFAYYPGRQYMYPEETLGVSIAQLLLEKEIDFSPYENVLMSDSENNLYQGFNTLISSKKPNKLRIKLKKRKSLRLNLEKQLKRIKKETLKNSIISENDDDAEEDFAEEESTPFIQYFRNVVFK